LKDIETRRILMPTNRKPLAVVILAAGKGTRMKSDLPKVLHPLLGKPILGYVLDTARSLRPQKNLLVVGHQAELLVEAFRTWPVVFVKQSPQLGTGHALQVAQKEMKGFQGSVLVIYGDVPLVEKGILTKMLQVHDLEKAALTLISTDVADPKGYGRIIRDPQRRLLKIVEEKDASPKERQIREINTGLYCFDSGFLFSSLSKLTRKNRQKEYYLTDLVQLAREKGLTVASYLHSRSEEVLGINDRSELARSGQILEQRILKDWMLRGVTIIDPMSTYIESSVRVGPDTIIGPFTMIRGNTRIGARCEISSHVVIEESIIKDGVRIPPFSLIKKQTIFA
jgi:bifunctional UDP-N-acetylglucosamine pyrophosphorylase / glucosamine-1-phosphate N-acetyltransferase